MIFLILIILSQSTSWENLRFLTHRWNDRYALFSLFHMKRFETCIRIPAEHQRQRTLPRSRLAEMSSFHWVCTNSVFDVNQVVQDVEHSLQTLFPCVNNREFNFFFPSWKSPMPIKREFACLQHEISLHLASPTCQQACYCINWFFNTSFFLWNLKAWRLKRRSETSL